MNKQPLTNIKALFKKPIDIALYLVFLAALLILIDLYTDINDHEENWSEFKKQHQCELRKTAEGNVQAAWLCDDGKIYYRWRQAAR